ncbi:ATP-dependent Clp protease ATP-binding subunit, partial [Candidatus Gottesmanbacteria bacterium]|nr:ATP-dependent Clp protease ATP-binding subunit [Candidatus Gottesmanbacteria bacterium]
DPGNFLSVVSFNLTSRLIATTVRSITIFYGAVFMLTFFFLAAIAVIIWALVPIFTLPLYLILVLEKAKKLEVQQLTKKAGDLKKLAVILFQHPQGQFIAWHLGLNPRDLSFYLNRQQSAGDYISLLSEIDKKTKPLALSDLYQIISDLYPPLKAILERNGLTSKDIFQAACWYEELEKKKQPPLILDLERIKSLPGIGTDWAYGYTVEFDKYSLDLTRQACAYPLLIGRDNEIRELERVLIEKETNNALVVGEPGVGRHIVVATLAHRILGGQCQKDLAGRRILSLDMHSLLYAKPSIPQVKGLAAEILDEAQKAGNIIIVIDELDKYVSSSDGRVDLSDVFIRFAQSKVAFIGLTTPFGYHKYIQNNPGITSLFEKVEIGEPPAETVLTELKIAIVPILERKYNLTISLLAVVKAVENADRYISITPFPAKAIELLDDACASALTKGGKRIILACDIDEFLSEKIHLPLGKLQEQESEKLKHLEQLLHLRIINQNEAIAAVSSALRRARLNISSTSKPIGSFLFLGPTGVGKTETAKALADIYYGQDSFLRFDMSQYRDEEGMLRLIGSLEHGLPGELTSKLSDRPFSLLLLDEFEKADQEINNIFLTLIDEGYISDTRGKKVDAKNTIIIATSNAGAEFIRERLAGGANHTSLKKELTDYIQQERIFSPELINRFDAVVVFSPLSEGNLREVAKLMLTDLNKRLAQRNISIALTKTLIGKLANIGFDPQFGARAIRRVIAEKIEDQVAQRLLDGNIKKGEEIRIEL